MNKHKVLLILLGWLVAVFLPPQMLFTKIRSKTA